MASSLISNLRWYFELLHVPYQNSVPLVLACYQFIFLEVWNSQSSWPLVHARLCFLDWSICQRRLRLFYSDLLLDLIIIFKFFDIFDALPYRFFISNYSYVSFISQSLGWLFFVSHLYTFYVFFVILISKISTAKMKMNGEMKSPWGTSCSNKILLVRWPPRRILPSLSFEEKFNPCTDVNSKVEFLWHNLYVAMIYQIQSFPKIYW